MHEKVRLLMEETSCEQGEAELALELSDQDLEKAILTIESLLRHIFALKVKFYLPEKNYYGLMLVVVNTKTETIPRLRTVVSYNPAIYENSTEMDWYVLEKLIYSYRLDAGSLYDFTQDLEQKMQIALSSKIKLIIGAEPAVISEHVNECFMPEKAVSTVMVEELSLAQYRRLPDGREVSISKTDVPDTEPGRVILDVGLIEDKNGKQASRLSEGEAVMTTITDTRDIAHYLAHLIGSRKDEYNTPLPAMIKKITAKKNEYEVQVYYSPGIIGVAKVSNDFRVKLSDEKNLPWWKKIILWS